MNKNNIIKNMRNINLIAQITNEEELKKKISTELITIYCGFDPTADSLHIGHLIPLICLKIFQNQGHKPIVLIGGATSMIGDPSFKLLERNFSNLNIVDKWINKIKLQISKFLNFNCGFNSALIVNNYDWFHKMNILFFLRNVGKYFNINQMINKDFIKQRLSLNKGLSFTEFTYNLLQSYDFYYLYKKYNVCLQIGGSDQWGNIISGIHLINRLKNKKVFGLTLPLVMNKNGEKFGKSEGNTIWLDNKKTSPYKFYQFWLNITDQDAKFFFTILNFLKINLKTNKLYNKCILQYEVAEKMTYFVHGLEGLNTAKRITNSLFFNKVEELQENDFFQLSMDGILKINLKKEDLQQALVLSNLSNSRSQAKKMIASNAISINGKKNNNISYNFLEKDKIFGKFTIICRGKKNFCLIEWNKK